MTEKSSAAESASGEGRPIYEPSYSIQEFCAVERITAPTYFKLRNQGLGPKEMRMGRIIRISHTERLRWQKQREKPTEAQRETDEKLRERARAISQKAVASPKHVSRNSWRGVTSCSKKRTPRRLAIGDGAVMMLL